MIDIYNIVCMMFLKWKAYKTNPTGDNFHIWLYRDNWKLIKWVSVSDISNQLAMEQFQYLGNTKEIWLVSDSEDWFIYS